MSIAIIDYGSGNLKSVAKAFDRCVRDEGLSLDVELVCDPEKVRRSSQIVLPGVGAFADCKAGLTALDGMIDVLAEVVQSDARPFMGICVGMQLMAEFGYEHGKHTGLGWLEGVVKTLEPINNSIKIPHMGWNELDIINGHHPLFAGFKNKQHVYFVHSYHMICNNSDDVMAKTDYGGSISAIVGRDNMVGTQFHPEKSQRVGLKLISNFIKWKP